MARNHTAETTPAEDILNGLRELVDLKRAGVDPKAHFPTRTYSIPDPSAWTPDRVRGLRHRLGIAQGTFARLVGVSTILAQGWEQGRRTPAPVAARLLDTVDRDPAAWLRTIGAELPDYPAEVVRQASRSGRGIVGKGMPAVPVKPAGRSARVST